MTVSLKLTMLEHQPELMNIEVSDVELRQILHEIGEAQFGGSDAVRVGDIIEATQCDPAAVAAILSRLRGKDILEAHCEQLTDHEARLSLLERWKSRIETSPNRTSDPQMQAPPIAKRAEPISYRSLGASDETEVFDFNTGKWQRYSQENELDKQAWRKSTLTRWITESVIALALLVLFFYIYILRLHQ